MTDDLEFFADALLRVTNNNPELLKALSDLDRNKIIAALSGKKPVVVEDEVVEETVEEVKKSKSPWSKSPIALCAKYVINGKSENFGSKSEVKRKYKNCPGFSLWALDKALDTGEVGPLGAIWTTKKVPLSKTNKTGRTRREPKLDEIKNAPYHVVESVVLNPLNLDKKELADWLNEQGYRQLDGWLFTEKAVQDYFVRGRNTRYHDLVNIARIKNGLPTIEEEGIK